MVSQKQNSPGEDAGGDRHRKRSRYAGRVMLGLYLIFAVIGSLNLFGTAAGQALFVNISAGCIAIWVSLRVQEFVEPGELGEKLEDLRKETQAIRFAIDRLERRLKNRSRRGPRHPRGPRFSHRTSVGKGLVRMSWPAASVVNGETRDPNARIVAGSAVGSSSRVVGRGRGVPWAR